jgi:hypothetical protein
MRLSRRGPARVAAAAVLLAVAVSALVSHASASRLPAARSHGTLAIVVGPNVQTVRLRVVGRTDARTGIRRPALVLGTATFAITVTNTSAAGLPGVTVGAPLAPGCNRRVGTLAAGVSIAYRCSATDVGRDFANVVTVSARPPGARVLAGARATASATARVKVRKPKTKRAHAPQLAFTG